MLLANGISGYHRIEPWINSPGTPALPQVPAVDKGAAGWWQSSLLGIETEEQVLRDPLVGNLFENLVVLECLKARYKLGKDAALYFFRDSNGNEIDLLHAVQVAVARVASLGRTPDLRL